MLAKLALLALAALSPLTSAAVIRRAPGIRPIAVNARQDTIPGIGLASIVNNCNETVHVWSVGQNIAGPFNLNRGGVYAEQFMRDPVSGGKALKLTLIPNGIFNGAAQTIFAYNLDGTGKIWYDLSDVFGDAFTGRKLVVTSAEPNCPTITFPNGVPPGGSQVKVCPDASKDVTLTLCAA